VTTTPGFSRVAPERVRQALEVLGIHHLLLGIQDAAFPADAATDVGRGCPASRGAMELLDFVAELGLSGLQLGPQGATSADNPSPYDGTLFSRNPASLDLEPLTQPDWGTVLRPEELAQLAAGRPGPLDRVSYRYAYASLRRAVGLATTRVAEAARDPAHPVVARHAGPFEAFRRAHADWLERDALYGVLRRRNGGRHFSEWPDAVDRRLYAPPPGGEARAEARTRDLRLAHGDEVAAWALVQYVLHVQHGDLRARARALGLELFGDLQIGFSPRDAWAAQGFVRGDYLMGAPPSRTNPEGQAWNYPVLDPAAYWSADPDGGRRPGPALRFLEARVSKAFAEFDGLRIDHPHGLVCPWVYRAGQADPIRAVQDGARLLASPDLPDHPALSALAVPRPDQLDRTLPRHADGWVRDLDDDQVARYATLFDVVMDAASARGRSAGHVACEILSTQPYPLGRVMDRHGIGRFRVTQKADLSRPDDVYRGENARPRDWTMLGNHDTPPIRLVARQWMETGAAEAQAAYLAGRLLAPGEDRETWTRTVARDRDALVQAKFAELFVGPAANVMVFFTDLFGSEEIYNRPGVVSEENWSLRVAPSFRTRYAVDVAAGRALDVPRALARALRSRGPSFIASHGALLRDLERR
jgi:4-alpha-glucanotransferase